jgi:hypothetical protein
MLKENIKKEIHILERHLDYLYFEYSIRNKEYEYVEIKETEKKIKSLYDDLKEAV